MDIDAFELVENSEDVAKKDETSEEQSVSGKDSEETVKADSQKEDSSSENDAETEKKIEKKTEDRKEPERPKVKMIASRNVMKIMYYLMAVDGTIYHGEEEKFDSIGKETDPGFLDYKEDIIKECKDQLDKSFDELDYYDVVQDGVFEALVVDETPSEYSVPAKKFLWNLLSVAYSDEKYDDNERRIIRQVARKLDIDKVIFLEMESSIMTLVDLEKEVTWIKSTDRPYLKIEAMVNEIQKRKTVVFDSIKDLIEL